MENVLVKAAAFVFIIFLGYALKRRGFFQPSDFRLLSRIVINITVPATIISSFGQLPGDNSLMILVALGMVCNLFLSGIGVFVAGRRGKDAMAFNMLNFSGYNIGCFILPYVQNFLGPVGIVSTCLFDAGNSFLCTGGTYSLASAFLEGKGKGRFKLFLLRTFSSIPILTFIIMLTFFAVHIAVPSAVVDFVDIIAKANGFLAMLMIGVGLELRFKRSQILRIVQILTIRYGLATILALVFYFVLPFPLEVRQALLLIAFAPISAVAVAYTEKIGGDVGLSGAINSASILVSMAIVSILLVVMGIG